MQEDSQFSQEKFFEFCKDMGYANDTAAIKQHLNEMWVHLKGNENETASVYNVKVLLSAIMNFNHPWMKVPEVQQ
jgi:ribosomal protein S8